MCGVIQKEFSMKNLYKVITIAVIVIIGFSAVSCEDKVIDTIYECNVESTNGQLVIKGLSSYNGKYIYADFIAGGSMYYAAGDITVTTVSASKEEASIKGKAISAANDDALVVLKVWKLIMDHDEAHFIDTYTKYEGTDTGVTVNIRITDDPTYNGGTVLATRTKTVNFTLGVSNTVEF
jgi:hypothetical protein